MGAGGPPIPSNVEKAREEKKERERKGEGGVDG